MARQRGEKKCKTNLGKAGTSLLRGCDLKYLSINGIETLTDMPANRKQFCHISLNRKTETSLCTVTLLPVLVAGPFFPHYCIPTPFVAAVSGALYCLALINNNA